MQNPATNTRAITRSCRVALVRCSLALLAALFVALGAPGKASAQTPPTINGDLTDLIQFATDLRNNVKGVGIEQDDPAGETLVTDPIAIPCPTIVGQYYQNGFDQTKYVVAQAGGSSTLYLGIRAAGIIGDTDGNGSPDNAGGGSCNPEDNVTDLPGIGNDESYTFYFDTNCGPVFQPTSTITITNDKVSGTGIFAAVTGSVADGSINYRGPSGHDLEVKVLNAQLPAAFKVRTIIGSIPDGLAEDFGAIVLWEPHPNLTITKVANPARVCVGKNTRFTLTVTNTGDCDLATVVEDDLPVGLSFAGNVSTTCNVGAPQVNGSAIQWPSFTLPFGASCTISFDVTASNTCFGVVTNHAHADGAATGNCVNQPPAHSETTFDVTCVDNPCVQVTASGPAHACPNTQVTISGNITSCSKNDETVVVTVNGQQAFSGPVAAGATVPYTFQGNMGACTPGGNVPFAVHAVATGECGTATADAPLVQVRCDDKPCVTLTCNADKVSACPGEPIVISGNVTNCSSDPEQIVVTVGGVQAFNAQVASGATVGYTFNAVMPACQAGASVPFPVQATASNACGPDNVKSCTATVLCKNAPCVQLLNVKANLDAACPNTPVVISGTVKNCGTDAATYTVTVGGVQVFTGSLDPNTTHDFQGAGDMGPCTAGSQVDFAVHATVSNACGDGTPADAKASVRCEDKPCVTLTGAPNPTSACPGDAIAIAGTVKNCSLDPETIVVMVNGNQVFNQPVDPGQTLPYSFQTTMPQCTAGANVPFTVVATATGVCPPPDVKTLPLTVLCKNPPCVDLIDVAPTVQSTCPNSPFQVKGTVKNCGTDAADYTVKVNGVQVYAGNLAAGATANFTADENAGACQDGAQLTYTVAAHASNSCGAADKSVDVHVLCQAPSVKVTKTAEATVTDGSIIHYSITVLNNGSAPLENLVITDTMCPYSTYNDNATPAAFSEPAVGANGKVVWHLGALAQGASQVFTFQAKASLAAGGASCATSSQVTCTNAVDVIADCAGSNGASQATSHAEAATTITCPSPNCPRTPGWWAAQCAQKANGSTKLTVAQLTSIASKVDDLSAFFNWAAGTDMSNFCRVISPPLPMDQRKQAKRQFATALANYAITALNITPSRGGKVVLDLNTPISCGGFQSTTVGALFNEVDQLLITLEGQNLNNADVKAAYGNIISCFDAMNNGRNIPVASGCEETSGTTVTSSDEGTGPSIETAATPSITLDRAVPNPFSSSTSFAFRVPDGGAAVDVGVYSVAGRLVKTLANGPQGAGIVTVTWDGTDNGGVRMAPGVYFLRSRIGSESNVTRVIYISR